MAFAKQQNNKLQGVLAKTLLLNACQIMPDMIF